MTENDMAEVIARIAGRAGRITLNRPKALNALSHAMVRTIETVLEDWAGDESVQLVLIDGSGEKAFSAGGDIASIYADGKAGRFEPARRFFADEYRMNRLIARYGKPVVALMDGIVMGGGVGIAGHASHRIVTERVMVAMPECAIGLVPDVGASLLLAEAPGRLGEYLALTGHRMTAGDAILAGFADTFVPSERLPALAERLEETGDPAAIAEFAEAAPESELAGRLPEIDRLFSGEDAAAILRALEAEAGDFSAKAAATIRKGSPLSVAATLALVRAVRAEPAIETALAHEYRFTYRAQSHGDFVEGTRAALIDKDRSPRWPEGRVEDLESERLAAVLAPLGDDELGFAQA
ncbi:enoyl-CoA hydratase/isomerase family protein [Aurantimonas sp. VKM B-3413]|uniref:enoyl-CoA hydratase/isomerase family protein n=1 Tax=Aurantimonas sp. VKM B-3413 TaxID=2779401 RepID=UPI001E2A3BAE|nr:enoyl-CoA hydratase/isomerase family protein [Aurantimonas sp. VKM B-3413]MCB8836760.1 enoyl-CoA hydratase/isomerase family protein [Aurantimonas sp. VKM B-3413]